MNDIYDYDWDVKQGRDKKPLVRSSYTPDDAKWVSYPLVIVSLTFAYWWFPLTSFVLFFLAAILGWVYNRKSKDSPYAFAYLGLWGAFMVLSGAMYHGEGITTQTIVLELLVGVHMVAMTFIGDLKDVYTEEDSIPSRLGCKLTNDGETLWVSARFYIIGITILLIQSVFMMALPVSDGFELSDIMLAYIATVLALTSFEFGAECMGGRRYDEKEMKRDIVVYEIITVSGVLIGMTSFVSYKFISLAVVGSIVWGLGWQLVLYGDPLEFP